MKKMLSGLHFYVNVNNLDSILCKEERETDFLKKAFHQLDTFVSTMEYYAGLTTVQVEKLTGSRLHFYVQCKEDDHNDILNALKVVAMAHHLAGYISTNIRKYKDVANYQIGAGMDYGDFTIFTFSDKESQIEEETSIGSPANRAAKLQSYSEDGTLTVSREVYEILNGACKKLFYGNSDISVKVALKYYDLTAYSCSLESLYELFAQEKGFGASASDSERWAHEHAEATNLGEVQENGVRKLLDFNNLSLRNCKTVEGIMLFADIRGFTKKFDPDGSNLAEMKQATQLILSKMNKCVHDDDGVHVQFQGDRISAIFHEFDNEDIDYVFRAYRCAFRLIDMVKELNENGVIKEALGDQKLQIGIGMASGNIFATRLGKRREKDNVAMGETVRAADYAEDEIAGNQVRGTTVSEIAVTKDCYELLDDSNSEEVTYIKSAFASRGKHYVSRSGWDNVTKKIDEAKQKNNHKEAPRRTSAKPWGSL